MLRRILPVGIACVVCACSVSISKQGILIAPKQVIPPMTAPPLPTLPTLPKPAPSQPPVVAQSKPPTNAPAPPPPAPPAPRVQPEDVGRPAYRAPVDLPVFVPVVPPESTAINLYVAPGGSGDGTLERPFGTLEQAREAARRFKGGVTVWLRGGTYPRQETFLLTAEDAGVCYRAVSNETALLIGGREITGFTTHRDKILKVDLRALGITDFGKLAAQGMGRVIEPAPLELFFNGQPMQLARWPNEGWSRLATAPDGLKGATIGYVDPQPARWLNATNIWLHGYWTYDWADSYVKVSAIDTSRQVFVTAEPYGAYGYTPSHRYYALNLLEELDTPGEYFLDRSAGILYFWPPASIENAQVVVSLLNEPVVKLQETSTVVLRDLTIGATRGAGIQVIGGDHNLITGCTIRGAGGIGIVIGTDLSNPLGVLYNNPIWSGTPGTFNGVVGCEITATGHGGIVLGGGLRQTLTGGNNFAVNNVIHRCSRIVRSYRPGILVHGVGNRVAHNLIHDLPHSAIMFQGNDHVIEYNDIHHVCLETDDCGAIYMGRDHSCCGNIIRYNFIHDLPTHSKEVLGIYLDDGSSGTTIFGNVFYNLGRGILAKKVRHSVFDNNLFAQCDHGGLMLQYGAGWLRLMLQRLEAVRYRSGIYRTRYPYLAQIYESNIEHYADNLLSRNAFSACQPGLGDEQAVRDPENHVQDNLVGDAVIAIDPAARTYQFIDAGWAKQVAFDVIPLSKVGPQTKP